MLSSVPWARLGGAGDSPANPVGETRVVILVSPVFHSIEKHVLNVFHAHIQARYGVDLAFAVEQPRQSEFGEMAVAAAFQLFGELKRRGRASSAKWPLRRRFSSPNSCARRPGRSRRNWRPGLARSRGWRAWEAPAAGTT